MTSTRILISGEGKNELGELTRWPRPGGVSPDDGTAGQGAIEALLGKVRAGGWTVVEAWKWKDLRKLVAGEPRTREELAIARLALHAREANCKVLAFVRDRDGQRSREMDVQRGIDAVQEAGGVSVVGGVAIEMLEAWVLAFQGETGSEGLREPAGALRDRHGLSSTSDFVQTIRGGAIDHLPDDATSLRRWLASAQRVLESV